MTKKVEIYVHTQGGKLQMIEMPEFILKYTWPKTRKLNDRLERGNVTLTV